MRTASDIANDVNAGASAVDELEKSLAVIREKNDELNVFLHVDEAGAYAAARAVDERVRSGQPSFLTRREIPFRDLPRGR